MRVSVGLIVVSGAAMAMAACHHNRRGPENEQSATNANLENPVDAVSSMSAVRKIAGARCDREERCNNIGDGEKYASQDVCVEEIREEWREDLNARECPGGIHDAQLEECLNDIRSEDCNSPFDTLARVTSCTAASICDDSAD